MGSLTPGITVRSFNLALPEMSEHVEKPMQKTVKKNRDEHRLMIYE